MYGAATSSRRIEAQAGMQAGIVRIQRAANIPRARTRGLSRSSCMRNDTSLQRRCSSMREAGIDHCRRWRVTVHVGARRRARRYRASVRARPWRSRIARASATRAAGTCRTAPELLGKAGGNRVRRRRQDRCRRPQWLAKAISSSVTSSRRPSGRGRRAAGRGPSARAARQRTRAAAPGCRDPPARRRSSDAPAPSTSRPGDSCRAPRSISSRREGCDESSSGVSVRARILDRRKRRDDQRHRRDHRMLAVRHRSTPSASTRSPCRPEW